METALVRPSESLPLQTRKKKKSPLATRFGFRSGSWLGPAHAFRPRSAMSCVPFRPRLVSRVRTGNQSHFFAGDIPVTISFQSCPQAIRTRTTRLVMESLENRALLAAGGLSVTPDLIPASSALQGDANLDGDFNSMDLVQVFQAGKYETSQAADWSAGDWNLDARFDSQDLIAALQRGTYSLDARPSAEIAVPFKGSLQAVNTFDVQFPTLFVDASGSGNATHLGHFTVTYEEVVNILVPGSGVGSAHFIAANGDSIFTTTETLDPPQSPEPNVLFAMVEHTITSGTGRFAGATGSFTEERFVNLITSVTSSSFDGTIVLHEVK